MLTLHWKRVACHDLPKAFDSVWHEDLPCKLKSNGIDGYLFKLIESFLNNRCQRVVLNDQSSVCKSVTTGVPLDSVIGQLFFLIYVNDLPLGLTTDVKLFADDTSLFPVENKASVSASSLNNDLIKIRDRALSGKCRLIQIILNKWERFFFWKKFLVLIFSSFLTTH